MPYRTLLAALLMLAALPAAAPAEDRLTVRGAGWGHGVGMSQYGALGFARHGKTYREILAHYYTGTALGRIENRTVRVLLDSSARPTFTGATRAGGKRLTAGRVYAARRRGARQVDLLSPTGRRMATVAAPLRVTGPAVTTGGLRYRGALELHPGVLGGLDVINAVALESYIRGVVPRESPAGWPAEALRAQAVAARTFAITTSRSGTFDHFKDTRSQVYGGVGAEVASTDAAVRHTRGEVVTYQGRPVITFFFSTSGGRTEDVENTSLGKVPQPWLKSVRDPYDDASPHHRWTLRMTLAQADRKLGNLVKGDFLGIKVLRRGRSPRIVEAEVIGTQGRTRTNGATLRARLGLRDTWAYFSSVTADEKPPPSADEPNTDAQSEGGTAPPPLARLARLDPIAALSGRIIPAARGSLVLVDRREGDRWVEVGATSVRRGGRFRHAVVDPGTYRVRHGDVTGPAVRIRRR